MKKIVSVFISIVLVKAALSQELAQVSFSGGSSLTYFSLLTDGTVLIRISPEGKILEWGTEEQSMRGGNYYAPKLQPYPGRIEYYGPEADSVSRGKVKSIGSSVITYFQGYETADKVGKVRSAGRLFFDYYGAYDNKLFLGKIKSIGTLALGYYSAFEDEAIRGKLRSVGNTTLTYYTSFDDKMIRGKIKTIGGTSYAWYTSLDREGFGGSLKSGNYRQNIAGVVYILQ
ncbi:MAG: hypothetical protein U0U70_17555 [Chitinophagaceae bacterium]